MSDRGWPDDRAEGGRAAAPADAPAPPAGGYDFGFGGWTYTLNGLPLPPAAAPVAQGGGLGEALRIVEAPLVVAQRNAEDPLVVDRRIDEDPRLVAPRTAEDTLGVAHRNAEDPRVVDPRNAEDRRVGEGPGTGENRVADRTPVAEQPSVAASRENSLKNRLRTRRAAERSARADPALSFGARPAPAPARVPDEDDDLAPPRADADLLPPHPAERSRRRDEDGGARPAPAPARVPDEDDDLASRRAEADLLPPRPAGRPRRRDEDGDPRPAPAPARAPDEDDDPAPRRAETDLLPPRPVERPRLGDVEADAVPERREPARRVRRPKEDPDEPSRGPSAAHGALGDAPDAPRQPPGHAPEEPRRTARGAPAPPPAAEPQQAAGGIGSRRAARVGGSGSVVIEERLFELVDWSSGGIAIRSDGQYYRVGDVRPLEVEIDLGDYAVNLDLDGEVVNRTSDRTGWRFRNPSETQRQVLRALTHAAAHERAFVAPRPLPGRSTADTPPRMTLAAPRVKLRLSPLTALMSLPFNAAVIGLVALGGILVIEGRSQPALPPAAGGVVNAVRAAVAVDRIALSAGAPGRIGAWAKQPGDPVALGEAVVTVVGDGEAAEPSVVVSPCDCILARILVRDARVGVGDELAALYPRTAEPYVQAVFLANEAPAVGDFAAVALAYASGEFGGTVVRVGRTPPPGRTIGLSDEQLNAPGTVYARIRTTPSVPAALAGDPALVTLRAGGAAPGDVVAAPAPRAPPVAGPGVAAAPAARPSGPAALTESPAAGAFAPPGAGEPGGAAPSDAARGRGAVIGAAAPPDSGEPGGAVPSGAARGRGAVAGAAAPFGGSEGRGAVRPTVPGAADASLSVPAAGAAARPGNEAGGAAAAAGAAALPGDAAGDGAAPAAALVPPGDAEAGGAILTPDPAQTRS